MTRSDIIKKVRMAGVIGKGGAGFPAYLKLSSKAGFVLANGAECEPLLSNDKVLMEKYPEEIVGGMRLTMQCVGAEKGYMCIKEKYKSACEAIGKAIRKDDNIEIFPLGDYYPAGDEIIMVREVLGRTVPEGGIPLDVGAVVNNVGTLKKIFKAVMKDEPVTRKYVSVNGEVKEPKVVNVPLGMKIKDVLSLAGGAVARDYAVIGGGPNMGAVVDEDDVIRKTTGALIVLPNEHPLITQRLLNLETIVKRSKSACLNCSFCTGMCPRNLIGHSIYPHKIMRAINLGLDSQVEALTGAFLCSGCGICENYACYMFLSPRKVCQQVKSELIKKGVKNPRANSKLEAGSELIDRKIPAGRLKARLGLAKYSNDLPLDENIHTADEVTIWLDQHIGSISVPVVKAGQSVKTGDMIADILKGGKGAVYHSSIDGIVAHVADKFIIIRKDGGRR